MTRQQRILRVCRRLSVAVAALGGAYIVMRFDLVSLPESKCCPLLRFEAGDRLIVDRRPAAVAPGDAVLVLTASGVEYLTLVTEVREADGKLWCEPDRGDCPGFSSVSAGWIDPRAARGRVLLSWEY